MIIDMIKNRDRYSALGASLPKGVILYGKPGLGKTLLAKSFVEECGLKSFLLRRNTGKMVDRMFEFAAADGNVCIPVWSDETDAPCKEDEYRSIKLKWTLEEKEAFKSEFEDMCPAKALYTKAFGSPGYRHK